jgi:hypothetical protein
MARPTRREVESCYGFLLWLVDQRSDHEYRDDLLDDREKDQLGDHMAVAHRIFDRHVHKHLADSVLDVLQWIEFHPEKLTFRNVGRIAGPLSNEIARVLDHEYRRGESPARRQARARRLSLPVEEHRADDPGRDPS